MYLFSQIFHGMSSTVSDFFLNYNISENVYLHYKDIIRHLDEYHEIKSHFTLVLNGIYICCINSTRAIKWHFVRFSCQVIIQ